MSEDAVQAVRRTLTPQEYLEQHKLTKYLKSKGLTDAQLGAVYFRKVLEAFRDWEVKSSEPWPADLAPEQYVWCALRWLVLENPPHSANSRAAWDLVGQYFLAHHILARDARSTLRAGAATENAKRAAKAETTAITNFRQWAESRDASETDLGQLVAKYCGAATVQCCGNSRKVPDREKRRIRALLKSSP